MPSARALSGPRRRLRWGVRLALLAMLAGAAVGVRALCRPPMPTLEGLVTVTARRTDLHTSLLAPGRTESAANTVVECQLERLEIRNEGKSSSVGGSSVITWVIEDGTMVKKGDLLCTLDASDYEELVRQQEIKVQRAKADLSSAGLDLDVAKLAVNEFRDGVMAQTNQQNEVALAVAVAEVERSRDRLAWVNKMNGKGYASVAQTATAEVGLKQALNNEATARTTLELFNKFGAPKQITILEAQVQSDQADLIYCQRRLTRYEERLAYYKEMVANCTIRAPHDGFVIYVPPKMWTSEPPIEAGSRVRQMQDLFYLPDLSRMRVATTLHESIVRLVHPGMRVRAKIEGISGRVIEGHVLEIEPLPDTQMSWISDTRSFKATIALDTSPRGLRPEMTAEVEIDIDRRPNVITVPVEAVEIEGGKDYCYVAEGGMLYRRPVKLGGSNPDLLEITDGLDEGEEVVSDVSRIDAYAPLIVDAPDGPHDAPTPAWVEAEKVREAEKAEKVGL